MPERTARSAGVTCGAGNGQPRSALALVPARVRELTWRPPTLRMRPPLTSDASLPSMTPRTSMPLSLAATVDARGQLEQLQRGSSALLTLCRRVWSALLLTKSRQWLHSPVTTVAGMGVAMILRDREERVSSRFSRHHRSSPEASEQWSTAVDRE